MFYFHLFISSNIVDEIIVNTDSRMDIHHVPLRTLCPGTGGRGLIDADNCMIFIQKWTATVTLKNVEYKQVNHCQCIYNTS